MKTCLYYHLCCIGTDAEPETTLNSPVTATVSLGEKERRNASQKFPKIAAFRPAQRSFSDSNINTIQKAFLASRDEKKQLFFKKIELQKHDIDIIEV